MTILSVINIRRVFLVFLGFLVSFRQSLFTHLGQRLVFFLERGGGGVHLGVRLLDVVDLVVFSLLVSSDFPLVVHLTPQR